MMPLSVFIIAGEASGDALGAGLMHELKARLFDQVTFMGVGGPKMQAEGLVSLFPYEDLSLMGFAEIVPELVTILTHIHQVVEQIELKQPNVVVTIDVPGFNFRVVKKLLKNNRIPNTRLIHYVAPTVWAYNAWRAVMCAKMFSHMLCLLPFEPRYFEDVGLPSTFVGHPVVNERQVDGAGFRARHNIAQEAPLVCIMAGSRKGEVLNHLKIFAKTINRLGAVYPNIAMVVPVPKHLITVVAPYFEGCPYRCVIVTEEQEKWDAVAASDVGLIKSGTVSLEVARLGLPQVVTYKTSWLSAFIIRKKILIPFVNLVNILLGREVIPELLQERCKPDYLLNALEALLMYPEFARRQQAQVAEALNALYPPRDTPHSLAADVVLKVAA